MFVLLLRKEMLDQLLSLRFALACILCLVITLSSALVWSQAYQAARADYQTHLVMHKNETEAANDLIDNSKELDFDGRAWMRPYFELRSDLLVLDSSFRDSKKFRSRSNLFFRSWYALRHHSRFFQLVSKMRNRVFLKLGRRIRQAREDVPVKSWQERGL